MSKEYIKRDNLMASKKYFDRMYVELDERGKIWKVLVEYMRNDIGKANCVLELGAGYCDFINNVHAKRKIALDIDKSSKKYSAKDVEFHVGKSDELQFLDDASVDVAFASNLFEHLTKVELEKTLKQLGRVLKQNGRLILLQPNFYYCYKEYFHDHTHKTIFTHVSMMDFLDINGFETIKVKPKLLPFSMQSKYSGKSLPKFLFVKPIVMAYLHSPIKPFAKQMYIVARKK